MKKKSLYGILGEITVGAVIVSMTVGSIALAIKAILWLINIIGGAI